MISKSVLKGGVRCAALIEEQLRDDKDMPVGWRQYRCPNFATHAEMYSGEGEIYYDKVQAVEVGFCDEHSCYPEKENEMAKKSFPKQLFVVREKFSDDSGEWFSAQETQLAACQIEERVGKEVAVYELVSVERLDIRKTVEVVKA